MNNDLISRKALKEVITANHYLLSARNNSTDYGMFTTGIMQAIDNSPTVVNEKLTSERPQGEWINREAVSNTTFPFWERYECNKCHKYSGYSNFCPNCGADMRKGVKKNDLY